MYEKGVQEHWLQLISRLGLLLTGAFSAYKKSEDMRAMLTVTKIDSSDDQLKRLWELHASGIANYQEHQRNAEEENAVN